jgi:dCMP deaminase
MEPCRVCAMLIVSVGITRVVAKRRYQAGGDTRALLGTAGVALEVVDETIEAY